MIPLCPWGGLAWLGLNLGKLGALQSCFFEFAVLRSSCNEKVIIVNLRTITIAAVIITTTITND